LRVFKNRVMRIFGTKEEEVAGTGVLSPGIKQPGREADHSPPSIAEVKNTWNYKSTPPYAFSAWCLVKHRCFI
jgi:hypothetical protein